MPSAAEAAPPREEISFKSAGRRCAGWLFRPAASTADVPCVVLAHGFGAVKEARLDAYARAFAEAGYAALAFDYRHFGDSEGVPRHLVSVGRQHEDWRSAIARARSLDGIDPQRIVLWGTSFSGGHVIRVAGDDDRIAAVIAQMPHADGIATLRELEPSRAGRLFAAGVADKARSLAGRSPRYVPTVGPPGTLAAMTGDDAAHGYPAMYPDGFEWRNEFTARVMLTFALYSPGRRAARVRCPLLVQVATDDHITPPRPALAAARRAPRAELRSYPLSHFEIYRGEPFKRALSDQLDFLARHVSA